ncbi:hypothetical protein [Parafrankia sp. FMc2]|uniref:hypothetical protein n=1 Tax=Parafrankia sp. FMc2 TaxID=3233196 RepID=UPI0034D4F7BF
MSGQAGLPAALLTPSDVELDVARLQIDYLSAGSYSGSYGALGAVASGQAGQAIRALRSGDLEAAAAILRRLAAADLAACELRDRLAADTAVVQGDPALGGLDELVAQGVAVAADTARTPEVRARAATTADAIVRTVWILTGKSISKEQGR